MKRRDFVGGAVAGAAGITTGGLPASAGITVTAPGVPAPPPNILLIVVDQMRYPTVFPSGIDDAGMFLARAMPNVHRRIWRNGVKFANHYSAATPCSPARAALVTGLYTQQSWILDNIGEWPYHAVSKEPWLNPGFPTYGKLLRRAGYRTPYAGKWHLSIPPRLPPRLQEYGFEGLTYYDPEGLNLQGTVGDPARGFLSDREILEQATAWLARSAGAATPWCLTVSFINPHDIEYYWGGTEFRTFNRLFDRQSTYAPAHFYSRNEGTLHPPVVAWSADPLKQPLSFGYPALPPNWEAAAQIKANKPATQAFVQYTQHLQAGGIGEDPNQAGFTIERYLQSNMGIGEAPYGYWQRGLDCYTQLMSIVDQHIGDLLDAIPSDAAGNTVLVLTSDHGDYAGAHGFVTGKVGSLYDEAFHVPLIVVDPSGRFTADIDIPRTGLTSSVDLLPMLAMLGNNGQSGWQTASLAEIYRDRHDLMAMLASAAAPGRQRVLLASDTTNIGSASQRQQYNLHLLGLRTRNFKFGMYAQWTPGTTTIVRESLETEFYDYATAAGRAELANTPDDPRAGRTLDALLGEVLQNELQAALPDRYSQAQAGARQAYLALIG